MERGLRQGDPMAPFLFLVVAKGLGGMMKMTSALGLYSGVFVGRENIEVSHLQFVDDTVFIGEAS
jgi:hypothetical protein